MLSCKCGSTDIESLEDFLEDLTVNSDFSLSPARATRHGSKKHSVGAVAFLYNVKNMCKPLISSYVVVNCYSFNITTLGFIGEVGLPQEGVITATELYN